MSSKRIVTIEVHNLKAIDHQAINLHGCSCIVTAGNRKGKSTLLRGLIDRIQGVKPEMVVKKDESNGFAELTLTTGERIRWEFSADGKERLIFVTKEGIKTGLTREIANRYFPASFDIDRFLQSSPKERVKQLQSLLGIDLTDINARYKVAYDDRTFRNKIASDAKAKVVPLSEEAELLLHVEPESTKALQDELAQAGNHNAEYQKAEAFITAAKGPITEYGEAFKKKNAEIEAVDTKLTSDIAEINAEIKRLQQKKLTLSEAAELDKKQKAQEAVKIKEDEKALSERLVKAEEWVKVDANKPKSVDEIKSRIDDMEERNQRITQAKAAHATQLTYDTAYGEWMEADMLVKAIEKERVGILQQAKLPEGITIDGDNIIVDGLPLDRLQQSTSELYIVALKLAALKLGEVGSLHFDAATLDRPSLEKVQQWAEANGLQLLIERPDFEGGEIEYQIIDKSHLTTNTF